MFDRANEDMRQAIDVVYAGEYPIGDFDHQELPNLSVDKVKKMAESTYAPFIAPGSLTGLSRKQTDTHLMKNGRFKEWCDRANDWSQKSIPAIVLVDISKGGNKSYILGDGQKRLAYADANGQHTIDVIQMRRKLAD